MEMKPFEFYLLCFVYAAAFLLTDRVVRSPWPWLWDLSSISVKGIFTQAGGLVVPLLLGGLFFYWLNREKMFEFAPGDTWDERFVGILHRGVRWGAWIGLFSGVGGVLLRGVL